MRFDVVVNMFVLQAYTNKKITVLGGDQIRPNIHIDDLVSVYQHFIENEFGSGIYNAGFENVSVLEIARLVKNWFVSDIEIKTSNDPRSYRQDSSKLLSTGFKPKKGIMNAIEEVGINLQIGKIRDDDRWHTVKWMASQMIGKL
jgi:nucleoside-diphosphate-sugar epimerase